MWTGTEMIVWGGMDSIQASGFHDDGGRFNPATSTWTTLSATGAPSARGAHSAIWTGAEMIIWGGASGGDLDSGARWSPTTGAWQGAIRDPAQRGHGRLDRRGRTVYFISAV